jgi:hypothetical protein
MGKTKEMSKILICLQNQECYLLFYTFLLNQEEREKESEKFENKEE